MMNILVTGGAGYIGSVVVERSLRDGHRVVVLDDLSTGHRDAVHEGAAFVHGSLGDRGLIARVLNRYEIEVIVHLAGSSIVDESIMSPDKYYQNNVLSGRIMLDVMAGSAVRKVVFSSTAAVYGEPGDQKPIEEDHELRPTNVYGETKLEFERILKQFEHNHGIRYINLRYFNAAGATPTCGERHEPETHLIPNVLLAARGSRPYVEVYGADYPTRDGTCVRDYIHVSDLADAHLSALKILEDRSGTFNLGCGGDGHTVREVINMARAITGRNIQAREAERRPGDPSVLLASTERAKAILGWAPKFDLAAIIDTAWEWMSFRQK